MLSNDTEIQQGQKLSVQKYLPHKDHYTYTPCIQQLFWTHIHTQDRKNRGEGLEMIQK